MRRIIALVATLCLLLTVVSVPAVAETEGTDWSSKEKLTITWTTYYTAPPAEDAVIIKHIEDTFNVDIDMLPIDDANFNEVLNTYIMGNNVPDVIRLKDPGQFIGYVDQGVLGELDMDILRANAPDICAAIDEFQDGVYWTLRGCGWHTVWYSCCCFWQRVPPARGVQWHLAGETGC